MLGFGTWIGCAYAHLITQSARPCYLPVMYYTSYRYKCQLIPVITKAFHR